MRTWGASELARETLPRPPRGDFPPAAYQRGVLQRWQTWRPVAVLSLVLRLRGRRLAVQPG